MSRKSKREYLRSIYHRYHQSHGIEKNQILNEFCKVKEKITTTPIVTFLNDLTSLLSLAMIEPSYKIQTR